MSTGGISRVDTPAVGSGVGLSGAATSTPVSSPTTGRMGEHDVALGGGRPTTGPTPPLRVGTPSVGRGAGVAVPAPVAAPPRSMADVQLRDVVKRNALPTRDQVIAKAGQPKSDFLFIKNDTAYKAILSGMDRYHALAKSDRPPAEKLKAMDEQLESLESQLAAYKDGSHGSRRSQMDDLAFQVRNERGIVGVLRAKVDAGFTTPPGMSLDDVLKWGREGIGPEDAVLMRGSGFKPEVAGTLLRAGFSAPELGEFRACGLKDSEIVDYVKARGSLADARRLHAAGVLPHEMVALAKLGHTVESALVEGAPLRAKGFDERNIIWAVINRVDCAEVAGLFSPQEAAFMRAERIPLETAMPLKDCDPHVRLPVTRETLPRVFTDDRRVGDQARVSGGAVSTVAKVHYQLPGDVRPTRVFFKLETGRSPGLAAQTSGVDASRPQVGCRNLAVKAIDDELRFGVIPRTEMGVAGGHLGVVMDVARGAPATKEVDAVIKLSEAEAGLLRRARAESPEAYQEACRDLAVSDVRDHGEAGVTAQRSVVARIRHDYTDPVLQRDLVALQLEDHVCGQVDRHGGNFLVHRGTREDGSVGVLGVRGIDNDQVFGAFIRDPDDITQGRLKSDYLDKPRSERASPGHANFHGVRMPPVVDTHQAARIDALTDERIDARIGHLVSPRELSATKARAGLVRAHVAGLRAQEPTRVIDPARWGAPDVTALLRDPNTSYVGREMTSPLPQSMRYADAL